MIEIKWKAREGTSEDVWTREIPIGATFTGRIMGHSERLFLRLDEGILALGSGMSWSMGPKIHNYQKVDITITVDAPKPE